MRRPVQSAIETAAREGYDAFLESLPEGSPYRIDPAFWQNLLDFIRELMSIFEDCSWFMSPERAVKISKDPNRRQKRVLRRKARQQLGEEDFDDCGKEFCDAVFKVGETMTEEKYAAMAAEV